MACRVSSTSVRVRLAWRSDAGLSGVSTSRPGWPLLADAYRHMVDDRFGSTRLWPFLSEIAERVSYGPLLATRAPIASARPITMSADHGVSWPANSGVFVAIASLLALMNGGVWLLAYSLYLLFVGDPGDEDGDLRVEEPRPHWNPVVTRVFSFTEKEGGGQRGWEGAFSSWTGWHQGSLPKVRNEHPGLASYPGLRVPVSHHVGRRAAPFFDVLGRPWSLRLAVSLSGQFPRSLSRRWAVTNDLYGSPMMLRGLSRLRCLEPLLGRRFRRFSLFLRIRAASSRCSCLACGVADATGGGPCWAGWGLVGGDRPSMKMGVGGG